MCKQCTPLGRGGAGTQPCARLQAVHARRPSFRRAATCAWYRLPGARGPNGRTNQRSPGHCGGAMGGRGRMQVRCTSGAKQQPRQQLASLGHLSMQAGAGGAAAAHVRILPTNPHLAAVEAADEVDESAIVAPAGRQLQRVCRRRGPHVPKRGGPPCVGAAALCPARVKGPGAFANVDAGEQVGKGAVAVVLRAVEGRMQAASPVKEMPAQPKV